jgi:organic radical activating enzyme
MNKITIPVVEINITEHCNLSCIHCDHSSPILPKRYLQPAEIYSDLSVLAKSVQVLELRITGGEPLLHPNLLECLISARSTGLSKKVSLVTNGTLLHQLPNAIWEHIDGLWISLYEGVHYRIDWKELILKASEHNVWIWKKERTHFDDNQVEVENHNIKLINYIYEMCVAHSKYNYCVVRNGRLYKCQRAAFMEDRLKSLGIPYEVSNEDGIRITKNSNLQTRIYEYIERSEPLNACRFCLGVISKEVPCCQRRLSKTNELNANIVENKITPSLILPDLLLKAK